jgi:hypothetical protein
MRSFSRPDTSRIIDEQFGEILNLSNEMRNPGYSSYHRDDFVSQIYDIITHSEYPKTLFKMFFNEVIKNHPFRRDYWYGIEDVVNDDARLERHIAERCGHRPQRSYR